jgi:hypothetical protein
MNREDAQEIRSGDILRIKPLWNQTEPRHKLPDVITVTDIKKTTGSQTGILIRVVCTSGMERWLDAGWFNDA